MTSPIRPPHHFDVRLALALALALPLAGCSAEAPSPTGEEVEISEVPLSTGQCAAKAKAQGDGSECQWCNCGMTSAAMMRYAMTSCSSDPQDYSGGKMRDYYQSEFGYGAHYCGSGNNVKQSDGTYELSTCGGDPARVGVLMEHIHEHDGGPNYASTTSTDSTYPLSTFKTKLASGYVAILNGGGPLGAGNAPCGFSDGHSIFVYQYDAANDRFLVYDPYCPSTGTKAKWWSAANVDHWSNDASGVVNVTIGKGAQAGASDPSEGHAYYWDTIRYPDLNGDGVSDVCGRASGGLYCALSTPAISSFSSPSYWTSEFSNAKGWTDPKYYKTLEYADLNGDGKDDVCGRGAAGMICALSTGSGFGTPALWGPFSDASGWDKFDYYYETITLVDVDDDGKADVCGRGSAGITCALSTGSSFAAASLWTSTFSNAGSWNTTPSYWKTIQYGDVNGDGKADVCGRANAGMICELSSGSAFGSRITTGHFSNAQGWAAHDYYWGTIRIADLNGDGKADLCGRGSAGILCALSTGSSFGSASLWTPAYSDAGNWHTKESYWKTIQLADLNGDGKMDICGRGNAGISCGLSNGSSFPSVGLWTTDYSNAAGWDDHPAYWGTIRVVKSMDGFGGDDVCGRAGNGIFCAGSTGTSFNPPDFWTDAYSDDAGWK